jgi:hypothetical protein
MSDNWMSRLGQSSAATTAPGSVPSYGMAFDLASGQWVSATQFRQFAEDAVATSRAQSIQTADQQLKTLHDRELELAQSIQNRGDDHGSWWSKHTSGLASAIKGFAGDAKQAAHLIPIVGGYIPSGGSEAPDYKGYLQAGGLLSRSEYEALDPQTRSLLVGQIRGGKRLSSVASAPGISQGLAALNAGYHASVTTANMFNTNRMQDGSFLFNPHSWQQAWRESSDQTLGQAMINDVLSPVVDQDRLDEWAKHSSLYQMTAFGSELAAGWYADPGVIAGKAVGATGRLVRNEAFLNESSGASVAMRQALHREQITVRNPVSRLVGEARANSMIQAQTRVEDFMRNASLAQASGHAPIPGLMRPGNKIGMFGGRTINGDAAASALWHAVRIADETKDRNVLDLTWGALHGDPKAYAQIETLKNAAVDDLKAYNPQAQTVFDSIEATKTKANQLEQEISDLQEAQLSGEQHPIYSWVNSRKLELKQQDLADAKAKLDRYELYPTWYQSIIPTNPDQARPLLNRVGVPKSAVWGTRANADAAPKGARHKFFMDNQYGLAHSFFYVPKASFFGWKNSVVEAHDVASGPLSFERQMGNLNRLFEYDPGDGLERAIQAWHRAPNERERINVAAAFENEHVIKAVAGFYNKGRAPERQISEDTFRAIYQHTIEKQNEMYARLNGQGFGNDALYTPSTMPTMAERADQPGQSVQLVKRHEDGSVEINLMDNGHLTTMVVPKEAWAEKAIHDGTRPVFEPQTPNYYNPIDAWRFHAELQSNPELLEALEVSFGRDLHAALTRGVDRFGERFNNLWKPTVLLRLGWPMRVLMDEGARGLAVLGPMTFAQNYGPAFQQAMGKAVIKGIDGSERMINRLRGRASFDIGNGPIRTEMRRTPLAAPKDLPAPEVPEEFLPRPNASTLDRITTDAARYREWERTPLTSGKPQTFARTIVDRAKTRKAHAFDLNGRQQSTGFVVPLPHTEFDLRAGKGRDVEGIASRFQQKWAPLLADKDYVVHVTPDGKVSIARRFTPHQRAKAQSFLRYVHDAYDGTEMRDLSTGKTFHYVDEPLPVEEAPVDHGLALPAPRDELAEFDNLIDDEPSRLRRKLMSDRANGRGMLKLKSSDGKTVEVPAPYEGHLGQIMFGLSGSEKTIDYISAGHGRAMNWQRRHAVGYKTYHAPEFSEQALTPGTREHNAAVEYFTRWADMVNDHLGSSPVVQQMIRGRSDHEIADWLTSTEEGGRVRRMMLNENENPLLWVNEVRYRLDKYLPSRELQRRLGKGRLNPSELRKYVADEDLPDIIGPELEQLDGRFSGKRFLGALMDHLWHAVGTAPIDTLSRHPFYASMYKLKARALTKGIKGDFLDEKMLDVLHKQAHAFAMQQTKRHLWSLVDETNFSEATRFIFPFWAAQREAIAKWAQIISDRPETVGRFLMGQRAIYNHFVVVDQNGQPVNNRLGGIYGTNWHPDDRVVVQIPKFLDKVPYIGQALRQMGTVGIPLGSANTVLQGESPMLPGFGPLVTVPADKLLRWQSETMGIPQDPNGLYGFLYNWMFPIGRPRQGGVGAQAINPLNPEFYSGAISQVIPGWAKRIQDTSPGLASANAYFMIARQMQQDAQEAGRPMPTPAQIQKVVRSYSALRVVTGLLAPFQVEYRPKEQFFLDQYHAYQRKYGVEADQKFLDDFGVMYARYVTSSSNSPVGVPGTGKGLSEAVANKTLLAKYGEDWGSAIISPQAWQDPFSYDAYSAEFQVPVGPGSSKTLRQSNDPVERDKEADRTAGWYEYQKLNAAIQAELVNRGLTNLQQRGAADLALLKKAAIEGVDGKPGLADKYPAWYAAYTQGQKDIYAKVHDLSEWVTDKRFDNRPDIQGVRQYLLIRKKVADALDAYHAQTGGSASLQAQENGQLRNWFYGQVGQLITDNPAFGEFYTRYLEGDTLAKGSGGF